MKIRISKIIFVFGIILLLASMILAAIFNKTYFGLIGFFIFLLLAIISGVIERPLEGRGSKSRAFQLWGIYIFLSLSVISGILRTPSFLLMGFFFGMILSIISMILDQQSGKWEEVWVEDV